MTASPRGYPFERIDYDAGQMNGLHAHLLLAGETVDTMQLVLRNVIDHLEGEGQAVTVVKSTAGEVADALGSPATRIDRLASIIVDYGRDTETYGGRANLLMADVIEARAAFDIADAGLADAQSELDAWTASDEYDAWRSGADTASSPGGLIARDARHRDAVESARAVRGLAASALDDAWRAWERSFEAWDDAYARALAALANVDGGYVSVADAAALAALADADSPAELAAIWERLDEELRRRFVADHPAFIGNLDGVPYEYRIAANVTALERASRTVWGEPTDTEIGVLLDEMCRNGGMPVSLNLFDENQATAAMLYVSDYTYDPNAFVDPLAGVTNVTVLLGGMMTELDQLGAWGETASDINRSLTGDDRGATIVWFGYVTPNLGTVGSMDQAVEGAETLTNALRVLDVEAPAEAVTTVIGHSYGSTTAFLAVGSAEDNLGVDRLIAIGSAGLTDHALGTDPEARVDYSGTAIYASTSPEDNWARKGRWAPAATDPLAWGTHPIDPGSLDGAASFESNGGYAPNRDGSEPTAEHHDGERLLQTPGHGTHDEGDLPIGTTAHPGGYLQEGSESFANIVNIIGKGEPLTTAGGYGSDDWWLW